MSRGFRYDNDRDDESGRNTNVKVTVDLIGETAAAWRVDAGFGPQWVPKSQCEVGKNRRGVMEFEGPEWLAKEKGFI